MAPSIPRLASRLCLGRREISVTTLRVSPCRRTRKAAFAAHENARSAAFTNKKDRMGCKVETNRWRWRPPRRGGPTKLRGNGFRCSGGVPPPRNGERRYDRSGSLLPRQSLDRRHGDVPQCESEASTRLRFDCAMTQLPRTEGCAAPAASASPVLRAGCGPRCNPGCKSCYHSAAQFDIISAWNSSPESCWSCRVAEAIRR